MTSSPPVIPATATTSPIPSSSPSKPSSPAAIPASATATPSPRPTKVALDLTDTSAVPTGPASAPGSTSTISPPLSPAAQPFFPAGHPRELSWAHEEEVEEEELECVDYDFSSSPTRSSSPLSYRDVLCRSPASTPTKMAAIAADGDGVAAKMVGEAVEREGGQRKRRRRSRRVRKRQPPRPLVAAPPRARDGRPLGRNLAARLGPMPPAPVPAPESSRRQPRVDADGFQEFVSRSTRRRLCREAARPAPAASTPSRFIPSELFGRCLNCLSYSHRVATCKLPRRCLRCHGFRHLARDCDRPRYAPTGQATRRGAGEGAEATRWGSGALPRAQPRHFRVPEPRRLDHSCSIRHGAGPRLEAFPRRDAGGAARGASVVGRGTTTRRVMGGQPKADARAESVAAQAMCFKKAASHRHATPREASTGVQDKTTGTSTSVVTAGLVKQDGIGSAEEQLSCCRMAVAFETACFREEWPTKEHDPMRDEAGVAQSRQCSEGVTHHEEVPAGSPATVLPQQKVIREGSAPAASVVTWPPLDMDPLLGPSSRLASHTDELAVQLHLARGNTTDSATDGSGEEVIHDEPELPPGFELGYKTPRTLDIVARATPVEALALAPPLVEIAVSTSAEITGAVVAPEVDHSMVLEAFINNVTKDIPAPLADKPPRRRRVDPILVDAPPQFPSSEAFGIRRSYRQALDPLSAVKPAKRGEALLMRRLGEVGVPLPLAATAGQAVKQLFEEGPPPHHMDALSDMFPMLKNKTSPFMGLSVV
ncbi:unnamed protein product [Urochloa humidicola]